MTAERVLMAFAGCMVLLSLLLTYYAHHYFVWLTVFVGANMFQSAFTGFCPAMMIIKKLGFKTEAQAARDG
jgi:hypothetical protein